MEATTMTRRRLRWSPRALELQISRARAQARAEGRRLRILDIARAADRDRETLMNWRKGRTTPSADEMFALAHVLGCSVEDFAE